jgi:hypothetical protein
MDADKYAIEKIKSIVEFEKDLFNDLRQSDCHHNLINSYDNLNKNKEQKISEPQPANKTREQAKVNKKKVAAKMKLKAITAMNKKRSLMVQKCGFDNENSSNNDTASIINEDNTELPRCEL